tara:strand:- start:4704 stop:5153 length:450 start_codon:yes stop_codon:yes gene_type:complete
MVLVIRPKHVSTNIDLNTALKNWATENEVEGFEGVGDYEGISLQIKQVSKEVYLESMARARSAGDGPEAEVEIYRAMGMLVQHGLQSLKGLEDDDGPLEVACVNGKLAEEDVEMLHDNGLVLDLWRAVKHYNELSATEKKQFGGPQPLT